MYSTIRLRRSLTGAGGFAHSSASYIFNARKHSAVCLFMLASQFSLDLFDARQAGLQFFRQGFQQFVLSNTHGLCFVTQGVFGHDLVFALAQQQANGGVVLFVLDLTIYGSEVKTQLPQMLWPEGASLELDDNVTAQLQVIEQQVDEEFVTPTFSNTCRPTKAKPAPSSSRNSVTCLTRAFSIACSCASSVRPRKSKR